MDDVMLRYGTVLLQVLESRGLKKRPIERRLGWSRGSLTKLCKGRYEMKVRQLLEILRAIGMEPLEFYRLVHSAGEGTLPSRLLEELPPGSDSRTSLVLPEGLSRQALEQLVEDAVRRVLTGSERAKDDTPD